MSLSQGWFDRPAILVHARVNANVACQNRSASLLFRSFLLLFSTSPQLHSSTTHLRSISDAIPCRKQLVMDSICLDPQYARGIGLLQGRHAGPNLVCLRATRRKDQVDTSSTSGDRQRTSPLRPLIARG